MQHKNKFLISLLILIILTSTTILANSPPVFEGVILDRRLDPGTQETINLENYFHDPDGDELEYSVSPTINFTIDIEGPIATIIPDYNFTGEEIVIFTASDGQEEVDSNEVYIAVGERIRLDDLKAPPIISNARPIESPFVLQIGQTQEFSIEAISLDDEPLTIRWELDNVEVATNTNSYTFSANNVGNFNLNVIVSDPTHDVAWSWQIAVIEEEIVETTVQLDAVCGDGIISEGETCANCPEDVQCPEGWVCDMELEVCVPETKMGMIFIYLGIGVIFIFVLGIFLTSFLRKKLKKKEEEVEEETKLKPLSEVKKEESPEIKKQEPQQEVKKEGLPEIKKQEPQQEVKKEGLPEIKKQEPQQEVKKEGLPEIKKQEPQQEVKEQKPQLRSSLIQDYYDKMKKVNKSDEEIRANLLKRGWTQKQLDEEWKYLIKK